ncbi:MAG: hypothetical protein KAS62_08340 [Candidatus Delongbacteria bacterium]|nr:hypothetical protein [Candidatus Delongbacteria bacterium]
MKYFTILILILALSFFYVVLVDKDSDDIEIQRIQLESNIDTNFIAEMPNNSFLKKIEIDLTNYTINKRSLIYDSLEYISGVIEFNDSLTIEIPKENRKNDIFLEFSSFSRNSDGSITIIPDALEKKVMLQTNTFLKHRVHIGKVRSKIIITKSENSNIYDLRVLRSIKRRWDRKKKKSIVIFDIAGLQDSLINDTINYPFFSDMKESSKCFTKTYLLSSNKIESKLSLLKCIEPYLNLNDADPFQKEKIKIMSELRNSSLPGIYDLSGYNTFYYGAKVQKYGEFSKLFKNSSFFSDGKNKNIRILQKFYNEVNENKDSENFYYLDINEVSGDHEYYLKSIDSYLKELFFHVKSNVDMSDYIFIIISSSNDNILKPLIAMFYSEKSIDPMEIDTKVNLIDISKTILSYSKLKVQSYFGGNNLVAKKGFEERVSILGSDLDTLMFHDKDILFKKQKYSDNYKTIYLSQKNMNMKKEDVGHIYNEFIFQNYDGDYIKYFIFKNDSDLPTTFNVKITSKNRFVLLDEIKDYYSQKRKKRRYENKIVTEIKPFAKDTIMFFYRKSDQEFNIKFSKKIKLAYGALSIKVGEVEGFYEESPFGTDHSISDKEETFQDYDVKILNRRINF